LLFLACQDVLPKHKHHLILPSHMNGDGKQVRVVRS
jgi:hypothetical protein